MTPISGAILTAAEMRRAEEELIASGISVDMLMARAGEAIADAVSRFGGGRPTLILCGPGNNGGDGYVAARLLLERGVNVSVAVASPPKSPAAIRAAKLFTGPTSTLSEAAPAPIFVDALFGTGLSRAIADEVLVPALALAKAADFVIAVDLPSGVSTDDGKDLGALPADLTIALGSVKPAHLLEPAAQICGHIIIADIGIATGDATKVAARPKLTAPSASDHKYSRGMVGIVGGAMPGAAILAAEAASRIAGYVVITGLEHSGPSALVRREWVDIAADQRIGALLIGPGLGRSTAAIKSLERALETVHPLVLDGDALSLLDAKMIAKIKTRTMPTILTPHSGEFSRVFGGLAGSKIEAARSAARACAATIIFKGADTVIAAPDGRASVMRATSHWLASAGTGDVLAGIVAGLLSTGMGPYGASEAAVWLHSDCARRAGVALIADELATYLPAAIESCL